ncbi:hypothetical protein Taro_026766 [Colocasia esculenta]|uniref:RING-type E3 ubiquitin transferase n=1 Tax=Colocasia esculenta TaxID=4460 RepID=A0A843VG54_COLES|nr:hypothetical protein [Colocasia esculenta]
MGGHGKPRWKISSLYRRSSPSSTPFRTHPPPPSAAADPPIEFVCPISGRLMADPVILPSGQTFERACAQACKDLGVVPPGAAEASVRELYLIPNLALKSAIHKWCDSLGVDRPQPVDSAAAVQLVSGLLHSSTCSSASPSPASSSASIRTLGDGEDEAKVQEAAGKLFKSPGDSSGVHQICLSSPSTSSTSATSYFTSTTTATSTFTSSSSSSSETLIAYDSHSSPKSGSSSGSSSPLEDEILAGLRDPQVSVQESALRVLRSATRDVVVDNRTALCTPKILAALRPMLVSRYPTLQSHAAASLVNLSLHPPNRVRIVRAGTVPAVVDALKSGTPEAQDHAAAALFSLSMDDENRAAIGVLGALPPLLHLFSREQVEERTRRDAATALYYLSMSGTNRTKLVKLGAIKTLLGTLTAPPQEAPTLLNPALMILCNLAACGDGRAAMMDAGAVEAVVRLLEAASHPPPLGRDPAAEPKKEHCLSALYGMSRGGLRFRGLAKAAGAEEVLRAVVEQEEAAAADGEADAGEREKRWRMREMARRTLRAAGGGGDGDSVVSESDIASLDSELYGAASEPAIRTRRTTLTFLHGVGTGKGEEAGCCCFLRRFAGRPCRARKELLTFASIVCFVWRRSGVVHHITFMIYLSIPKNYEGSVYWVYKGLKNLNFRDVGLATAPFSPNFTPPSPTMLLPPPSPMMLLPPPIADDADDTATSLP